jgi:hypothetical protein
MGIRFLRPIRKVLNPGCAFASSKHADIHILWRNSYIPIRATGDSLPLALCMALLFDGESASSHAII